MWSDEANDGGSADNNGDGQAPEAASLTLLQKHSLINEYIHQARSEISQKLKDLEQSEHIIEQSETDRRNIEAETIQAQNEHQKMLEELETTGFENTTHAQDGHALATHRRTESKRKLDAIRQVSLESQLQFLHDCGTYRRKIQRLAWQGEMLGLGPTTPSLAAYSLVMAKSTTNENDNRGNWHDDTVIDDTQFRLFEDQIDSMLRQGSDETQDGEIQRALQELQEQKDRNDKARELVQSLATQKKSILEEQEKRSSQKDKLQAQLQRLQCDVGNLQSEIDNLERATDEARQYAEIYRTDVEHRRRQIPVGGATYTPRNQRRQNIHNPYAALAPTSASRNPTSNITPPRWLPQNTGNSNSSSVHQNPKGSGGRGTNGGSVTNVSSANRRRSRSTRLATPHKSRGGTNARTPTSMSMSVPTSTEQFPHRLGRVRHSRFGAPSLRISSGIDDRRDDEQRGTSSAFQSLVDTSFEEEEENGNDIDTGDEFELDTSNLSGGGRHVPSKVGASLGTPVSQSRVVHGSTAATKTASTARTAPRINLDDSDDDDDEEDKELLSYVPAFRKSEP